MNARAVVRVSNPSPEDFLARFVRTQTPAVLTGTFETTYLEAPLLPSNVTAATAGRTFNFKYSSSGAHPNFRANTVPEMFARRSMTFSDFFERIQHAEPSQRAEHIFTGDEHYLWRVREGVKSENPDFGSLASLVHVPRYVPQARVYSVWTWFSGKGVRTWLHYDNNACHNLNLQVHGAKCCTLLPPETCDELEFFEPGGPVPAYNCSRIDVDSSRGEALLRRLPRYEARLQPGDLLFIPAHWVHAFTHEGDYNANVNFWWQPDVAAEPSVHYNAIAEREARLPQRHKYQ